MNTILNKIYPKEFKDFDMIKKNKYKRKELQHIGCSFNKRIKLKKKEIMIEECYNLLRQSYYQTIISKNVKKFFVKRMNQTQQECIFNRELCTNIEDFLTMESIREIPYEYFICYKDSHNIYYGFNLISIYTLIIKKNNKQNPYTREPFTHDFLNTLNKRLLYNNLFKYTKHLIVQSNHLSIDNKIKNIFEFMDSLGNYTDSNWLLQLNQSNHRLFIIYLYDIWNYRADLSSFSKKAICPPDGDPFYNIPIRNLESRSHILTLNKLKEYSYKLMINMVQKSHNRDNQILGSLYVLSALTLVNNNAAQSLPWLYQGVS